MKNAIKAMFHGKDVTEDEIKRTKEELFFINDKLSLIRDTSISYNEACEAFSVLHCGLGNEKQVFIRDLSPNTYTSIEPIIPQAPARVKCVYCDCVNNKDYGTCEFCGAPLKI